MADLCSLRQMSFYSNIVAGDHDLCCGAGAIHHRSDVGAFGVGIGGAVGGVLRGEGSFEVKVLGGGIGVKSEEIAEEELLVPEGAPILGDVQVARARPPDAVAEEAAIGEVGAVNVLIAETAQWLDTGREVMLQGAHGDHDVDDRLRTQPRHRCAANMLDGDDTLAQGVQNAIFLVFVALGPVGIILGENNCCTHRLPPFQQSSSTSYYGSSMKRVGHYCITTRHKQTSSQQPKSVSVGCYGPNGLEYLFEQV